MRRMLPSSADWIAALSRISGKSVTASISTTPQAWLAKSPRGVAPIASRTRLRAVAADHVLGADHRLRAGRHVLQRYLDGMHAFGFDLEVDEIHSVIGHEPCRRFLHVILEVLQ